jgi:hypothetical protein
VSIYVEPEKLAIFKIFLIVGVGIGAKELQRAVVEISASLCFIKYRVIEELSFILANHVLGYIKFAQRLLKKLDTRVIRKCMLEIRVASHIGGVVEVAGVQIMLVI